LVRHGTLATTAIRLGCCSRYGWREHVWSCRAAGHHPPCSHCPSSPGLPTGSRASVPLQPAQVLGAFQLKAPGQRLPACAVPEHTHMYMWVLPSPLYAIAAAVTIAAHTPLPLLWSSLLHFTTTCVSAHGSKWGFQPTLGSRPWLVLHVGSRGGAPRLKGRIVPSGQGPGGLTKLCQASQGPAPAMACSALLGWNLHPLKVGLWPSGTMTPGCRTFICLEGQAEKNACRCTKSLVCT
jgi:hypothetical protein